jgi:hypothetical protein
MTSLPMSISVLCGIEMTYVGCALNTLHVTFIYSYSSHICARGTCALHMCSLISLDFSHSFRSVFTAFHFVNFYPSENYGRSSSQIEKR